jgi:hypothetical protein
MLNKGFAVPVWQRLSNSNPELTKRSVVLRKGSPTPEVIRVLIEWLDLARYSIGLVHPEPEIHKATTLTTEGK